MCYKVPRRGDESARPAWLSCCNRRRNITTGGVMKHRLVVVIGASIVLGVLLLPGSGQAANAGEACQIAGSATITPGLTLKPHSGTVSFSGHLTNCHGSGKGITSGSVTGSASGLGSCEAGKSHLSATISWNNGTSSSVSGT